ncbi:TIM21-domain-containing protein [Crucibulum laeve]|uniref:Mitochondrial import inner membrane translocase subunit Tim21 n=1 Tax=Crucibulum laeve TaxID=68775 RepID=A0A5C3MBW2_9AGAR|nr:TIM21-domain-containing protein [Crucibulum laeve]
MNIPSLFLRAHTRCSNSALRPFFKPEVLFTRSKRRYATNHPHNLNHGPSDLSQSLDTRQQRSGPRNDSVGPFQLGLSQAARQGEKVQKWSELSAGGKVLRTTARTTNLTVILLGAGLSALLIYSLTSELFSKNSPTVLYGDACERLQNSAKLSKYLNGPLSFHNNPPSAVRPRHRNRHVTSQIMVDAYGNEHMIMTFYVKGHPEGHKLQLAEDSSYLDTASKWATEKFAVLSEMSLDDAVSWSKDRTSALYDQGKRAFKYLTGAPVPTPSIPSIPEEQRKGTAKKEESKAWSFAGMFSSLKGSRGDIVESAPTPSGKVYTDGEVHADLIRNDEGYFVFRYLLVDIPSSRDRNPIRVFVERTPGVRENEPVMRWNS